MDEQKPKSTIEFIKDAGYVLVVRCKDCKHGRIYENCVKCENAGNPGMFATYHQFNWFCADGKKRNEE